MHKFLYCRSVNSFANVHCVEKLMKVNSYFYTKAHLVKIFLQFLLCFPCQFYIQWLYRPHLGTWILPFRQFGQNKKISETTEFLLKYATFWGGFFNFLEAKKFFFQLLKHFSNRMKKLHNNSFIKNFKILFFLPSKIEKIGYHSRFFGRKSWV